MPYMPKKINTFLRQYFSENDVRGSISLYSLLLLLIKKIMYPSKSSTNQKQNGGNWQLNQT